MGRNLTTKILGEHLITGSLVAGAEIGIRVDQTLTQEIDATAAGKTSNFTAALGASELASFNAANPYRLAVKHAHSQQNPERDWGIQTLNAVRFAIYVLNEQFSDKFDDGSSKYQIRPDNTIVIASSVVNDCVRAR